MHSVIKTIFRVAHSQGHHFFLWRLPRDKALACMVSFAQNAATKGPKKRLSYPRRLFHLNRVGFVMHGAEKNSPNRFFFEADLLYHGSMNHLKYPTKLKDSSMAKPYQEGLKNAASSSPEEPLHLESFPTRLAKQDISKEGFMQNVRLCTAEIKKKTLQKVVISRQKSMKKPAVFEEFDFYEMLLKIYPDSFVSLVHSPLVGTWIVASPEVLITLNKRQVLETVSLAGTQLFDEKQSLRSALWSHKEIEEQSLVTKHIIDCFKSMRLRDFDYEGPRTVQTGGVLHLKSFFSVDTKRIRTSYLADKILTALHPTSAVCGTPYPKAQALIRRLEPHQRGYYTGFLGPLNVRGESHLFVNIRTMRLFDTHLVFYAGTGITRDSVPLAEWQETEWKIHALFKAIFL